MVSWKTFLTLKQKQKSEYTYMCLPEIIIRPRCYLPCFTSAMNRYLS